MCNKSIPSIICMYNEFLNLIHPFILHVIDLSLITYPINPEVKTNVISIVKK